MIYIYKIKLYKLIINNNKKNLLNKIQNNFKLINKQIIVLININNNILKVKLNLINIFKDINNKM